jgi:hypothetical protein
VGLELTFELIELLSEFLIGSQCLT